MLDSLFYFTFSRLKTVEKLDFINIIEPCWNSHLGVIQSIPLTFSSNYLKIICSIKRV